MPTTFINRTLERGEHLKAGDEWWTGREWITIETQNIGTRITKGWLPFRRKFQLNKGSAS